MAELIEQTNFSIYSSIKSSNNSLAKQLKSIPLNQAESQVSNNNLSDDNKQIILKIINNSELNENNNYKNLYEELQLKYNSIKEENNNLKIENQNLKNENKELKLELNQFKENEIEIKKDNNSISNNIIENLGLSLTKRNSNSSIFLSSCMNDEEINDLNEAKINQSLTEIKKNEKNLKIKEKYNLLIKSNVTKSISKNDLKLIKEKEMKKRQLIKDKANINIKNFRKKYKISDINKYPDDIIIHAFRENNFDEDKAYQFLINT